eukprot:3760073-Rhodomonas_salina.5
MPLLSTGHRACDAGAGIERAGRWEMIPRVEDTSLRSVRSGRHAARGASSAFGPHQATSAPKNTPRSDVSCGQGIAPHTQLCFSVPPCSVRSHCQCRTALGEHKTQQLDRKEGRAATSSFRAASCDRLLAKTIRETVPINAAVPDKDGWVLFQALHDERERDFDVGPPVRELFPEVPVPAVGRLKLVQDEQLPATGRSWSKSQHSHAAMTLHGHAGCLNSSQQQRTQTPTNSHMTPTELPQNSHTAHPWTSLSFSPSPSTAALSTHALHTALVSRAGAIPERVFSTPDVG